MASIPNTLGHVIPAVPDRGRTLYEEFRAVLPYFPDFVKRARQTYSWARDDDQAIEFAWEAVIYSKRPEDQARAAGFRHRLVALGIMDALGVELFVRHILTHIGGEVRAGRRRMTGVHYHTQQRFDPDASCLDTVRGEDRVRNRCRDEDSHVILDIRFQDPAADQAAPDADAERSDPPPTIELPTVADEPDPMPAMPQDIPAVEKLNTEADARAACERWRTSEFKNTGRYPSRAAEQKWGSEQRGRFRVTNMVIRRWRSARREAAKN